MVGYAACDEEVCQALDDEVGGDHPLDSNVQTLPRVLVNDVQDVESL
jgi:hypothetical protein